MSDSTDKSALSKLKSLITKEKGESTEDFYQEKIARTQEQSLEKVLYYSRSVREYLKTGIDTTGIKNDILEIRQKLLIAGEGIFKNKEAIQTHRNLTTTSKIVKELQKELNVRTIKVESYRRKLFDYRNNMDSLLLDSVLFIASNDSLKFVHYLQKLVLTAKAIHPVDSMLEQSINSLQKLKDQADNVMFEIVAALDHIEHDEIMLSSKSFEKETDYLWQSSAGIRPLNDIVRQSVQKGMFIFKYYAGNHVGRIVLLLVLILFAVLFITALKKKALAANMINSDFSGQLVIRYPLLSALLIVINVVQFIFPDPPFIFNCLLWSISTACLTWIFMSFISRYWMVFWLSMWMLFLLVCADNLILHASHVERWIMLGISSVGLLIGLLVISKSHRIELREKAIVYFIICFIIIEVLAIAANLYGRFNLSKSLLTSGFISLIIAISFLWTVRLINEGLTLASQMFQIPERRLFYINFNVIGSRAPLFLYVFLVIGWFIILARNFFEFRFLTEPVKDFIYDEIPVGEYSFSIYTIMSFFVILVIATVLSRIISFFGTEPASVSKPGNERSGLGSWILLIRIFVIVMGMIVAFAVAGIPLDKATFVLGALGVGIGFGFQSLVQHLVSGIILTVEKPVNVGDFVEIKGQVGTIRSIGFRSSVLMTIEGSNVIIPNGDILNESITNWTNERGMSRRTVIEISVAYETDLDLAKKILLDLTVAHGSILKKPTPFVLASSLDVSSINLQVFFWASTPVAGSFIKSELIIDIQKAFKENNIEIPFPQQDVYIKSIPSDEK